MKFLIPIDYSNSERPTVLGRHLHDVLEVKSHYKDWFPRMCEYGFEEGVDYVKYDDPLEKERPEITVSNPNPKTNHQLTLDMAKEIAMIQRTPIGRKIRKYFIEAEKQYREKINSQPAYDLQPGVAQAIISAGQAANGLITFFDVNTGVARACALNSAEKQFGVDLSDFKKLLPASDSPEELTPTLIAQQLSDRLGEKYTAKRVNLMLAERGLQYKDSSGWKLTDSGKHFGAMYPYERNGHTGYQLCWNQSVVTTLLT